MKKQDIIIGIDPDIDQSGVATITMAMGSVTAQRMRFPDLIDHLASEHNKATMGGLTLAVHVEAGWFNTSNWHTNRRMGANYNAAIGQAVGRNQAVGMKILEMCGHIGVEAHAVRPLPKTMRVGSGTLPMWGGADGKVRADELGRLLAGCGLRMPKGRTNQDERDAVLIALRGAGYVICPRKCFYNKHIQ